MGLMVITNQGKEYFLGNALGTVNPAAENYAVQLFKNDYNPVDTSKTPDFIEADFTGYVSILLAGVDFSDPVTVANVAESESVVNVFFDCTGSPGNTVYGWYLMGTTSFKTYAAQRFDEPRNMIGGAHLSLDPFKLRCKTFI